MFNCQNVNLFLANVSETMIRGPKRTGGSMLEI